MAIVVCKKTRLGKDGDKFKKNMEAAVLRTSVKIDESEMESANKLWAMTGILYTVDKKATKERNDKLNPKPTEE